ncbi:hypothetical protein COLO4_37805 [Corchorus olitorius]|uniref:Uncharacterized protein n=1 Tax=Corchorus olitorius TaxID=93759 RepID=A0A1R3FZ77_9ROSI|nr:hypothetical protein COLO4_37805 [Corchorus olitorius]
MLGFFTISQVYVCEDKVQIPKPRPGQKPHEFVTLFEASLHSLIVIIDEMWGGPLGPKIPNDIQHFVCFSLNVSMEMYGALGLDSFITDPNFTWLPTLKAESIQGPRSQHSISARHSIRVHEIIMKNVSGHFQSHLATGASAEASADAVEDMEINEDEADGDDENKKVYDGEDSDEGSRGVQVVGEEPTPVLTNVEFDASASKPPSQHDRSKKSVNNKKRSKSGEEFDEKKKRLEIVKAIMKLPEFTKQEQWRVGQHIIKDPAKIGFFFALLEEDTFEYVQEQLNECSAEYCPSFDFGGDN